MARKYSMFPAFRMGQAARTRELCDIESLFSSQQSQKNIKKNQEVLKWRNKTDISKLTIWVLNGLIPPC